MAQLGSQLTGLNRCPQCQIANPLLTWEHAFSAPGRAPVRKAWFIYKCSSCHDIVAAQATLNVENLGTYNLQQLLGLQRTGPVAITRMLPDPNMVDDDVPQRARTYLEQAISSSNMPDGAVMLASSAIDAMLKFKGYKDGSLFSRIETAEKDHVLTQEMCEWAHSIRLEGNKVRHSDLDDEPASPEDARQSIEFAKALAQFLFILPARISRQRANVVSD